MVNIRKCKAFDQDARDKLLKHWIEPQYGSVSAFAAAIGISRNSMYDILNGKYYPRVKHYLKMCEYLNIDPWLMQTFLPDLSND